MSHAPPDPMPPPPFRNLPRSLSGFVGRSSELHAITALLVSPGIRLLTITGPGGIGKTRLALESASLLDHAFPDGMVFVSLAATNDPDHVPADIAHALALDPTTGIPLDDAIHGALNDQTVLIVLDNLEHLLPAGPVISHLLTHHPGLTILATSRTRLDLTGEHVFVLDPLAPADARALFIQRASALQSHAPTPLDAPTVAAICDRLDRIPLAIELAAARTASLPPAALLDRLSTPLAFLRNGPRDVPLRHQTMRDTIRWSYALLDPDQRAGFRRLAVFVGGFTLDAAQDVLGADLDALDLVEFLVARSLVVPMLGESAHPRFTMLESIRQFGIEELVTTGEDEPVRAAHADWLIRLADYATPFLDGPELGRYLTILNEEMDNYRAAIAWSIQRQDGRRANRLTGGIWRIWGSGESRWRPRRSVDEARQEARSWTEQALALSEGIPFVDVVEAMTGMGLLLDTVKDLEPKRILMEELLQRSREASLPHGAYWAHFALADIARARGDWPAARAEAEAAIALAPLIRDPDNQRAGAEIHLAGMLASEGNLEAARDHYLLALEYGERAGNPLHLALATISLASMHRRLGNAGPSAAYALQALDLLATLKDVARTRIPYMTLAELARTAGRYHEAIRFLAHAASVPSFMNGTEVDDTWLTRFRALLPPAEFTTAWEEGTAASPEVMREWAQDVAHSLETTSAPDLLIVTVPLLTPREEDVLRLLVAGRTNRAIGDALFISERTVEKHVLHIMTKLDLDSRTGIVAWAVRNGVA